MQDHADDALLRSAAVFAANRAYGAVTLDTRLAAGKTRRGNVHEAGSLRVRFPNPDTSALAAVLINTAGGIAGGDQFDITLHAGAQTRLTVTTAAAEKIYRSHGPEAQINVTLRADADARLLWLPQKTILFDQARAVRRIEIDLAETASLLLAEIVVFGRAAMQEHLSHGSYRDRWRLRRGGKLIWADNILLGHDFDNDIGRQLAQTATADGGVAIATVLAIPGDEGLASRIRDMSNAFGVEVGVSAWNGFMLARFCGADAARLRTDVVTMLTEIDATALPRIWLN